MAVEFTGSLDWARDSKKITQGLQLFFFFNFVKLLLFYTSVCNNLVDFFGGCSPGTPAIPAATHEFAALCLKNALHLLPEDPLTAEKVPIEDSDTV